MKVTKTAHGIPVKGTFIALGLMFTGGVAFAAADGATRAPLLAESEQFENPLQKKMNPRKEERSWFDRFFDDDDDDADDIRFVEIKNIVITLNGAGGAEHYMQLELALTALGDENAKISSTIIPALRGATVNILSNRDYKEVRAMSVEQLRIVLIKEFQKTLFQLNIKAPFNDVVISRLVFQ